MKTLPVPAFKRKQIDRFLDCIIKNNFDKDKIEITFGEDTIRDLLKKAKPFSSLQNLFLNEAYIHIKEFGIYSYFKKDNHNNIYFMCFQECSKYILSFTCNTNAKTDNECIENDNIILLNNTYINEEIAKVSLILPKMMILLLCHINDMVINQKINIKEISSNKKVSTQKKKKSKKIKNVRNIVISQKIIEKIKYNNNENDKKQNYERHTESWTRRGHYRHYKNGKTIWVPASTCKAKEKPKKDIHIKKNYIIK